MSDGANLFLLGFTIFSGLVAAAFWGIAGLRQRTKTPVPQARQAVEGEIEAFGKTIDRLTQERDQQRAAQSTPTIVLPDAPGRNLEASLAIAKFILTRHRQPAARQPDLCSTA